MRNISKSYDPKARRYWNLKDLFDTTLNYLKDKKIENPRFNTELIFQHVLGFKNRVDIYLNFEKEIKEEEKLEIRELIRQRVFERKPIEYIVGKVNFYSYEFYVREGVLIPRQETEDLIDVVLNIIRNNFNSTQLKILDLAAGSGVIGITLKLLKKDLEITLSDISKEAIDVSKINRDRYNLDVNIVNCDGTTCFKREIFDIIVSNPPYIEEDIFPTLQDEIKRWEPEIALISGKDGLLFHRKNSESIMKVLREGGYFIFEFGRKEQIEGLKNIYKNFKIDIVKDSFGNWRFMIIKKE